MDQLIGAGYRIEEVRKMTFRQMDAALNLFNTRRLLGIRDISHAFRMAMGADKEVYEKYIHSLEEPNG